MKNFKLFEKCNRRIARRVTLIAVLLAMCIPQAWAERWIWACNIKYYTHNGHEATHDGYYNDTEIDIEDNDVTLNFGTLTQFYLKESKAWASFSDNWGTAENKMKYGFQNNESEYNLNWGHQTGENPKEYTFPISEYDVIANAPNKPGQNTFKVYYILNYNTWQGDRTSHVLFINFTIPGYSVSPSDKSFGTNIPVNTESETTISFVHHGDEITTGDCEISGTDASDFSVRSASNSGVNVVFTPTTTGSKTATLTITDAYGTEKSVTLSGTAVAEGTKTRLYFNDYNGHGDWAYDGALYRFTCEYTSGVYTHYPMTSCGTYNYYADVELKSTTPTVDRYNPSSPYQTWNSSTPASNAVSSTNPYVIAKAKDGNNYPSYATNHTFNEVSGGYIYYDNSVSSISNTLYLIVGHDYDKSDGSSSTYSKTYSLSSVSNTKLYYRSLSDTWHDADFYAVVGASSDPEGDHNWGSSSLSSKGTGGYTGASRDVIDLLTDNVYLGTSDGGGDALSMTKRASSAASGLNSTQTIKYSVSWDGNETYSELTSGVTGKNTPAQIQISAYKFNDGTYSSVSNTSNSQTISANQNSTVSKSVPAAYTGATTLTYSSVGTHFDWIGWYDAANGGSVVSSPYYPKTAGTVYARLRAKKYTVTYNANGGSCGTSSAQATAFTSVILPTPTWSGYSFDGWYSNGEKIGDAGDSYTPTADITLYAKWTDNTAGKIFSFIDNNYGDKFKGFTGYGWVATDSTGRNKTFTNASTEVQYIVSAGCWDNKSNAIAALAKFKKGTTSMSVVIPTGKIATVKISYGAYANDKGTKYGPLTVAGSNKDAVSTALTNEMTNAQVIGAMKEITLNSQTGTLTLGSASGNIFIGRVSAVITGYTISYNPGEYGSGSIDAGTKTHGTNFTLSSSTFSRDGYTQDGWSTEDGGTKAYNLGGTYSTDAAITLYPHWVQNTYTVTMAASPAGYGSVSPTSIASVPHGSTVSIDGSTNVLTLNGTNVTPTPASSTAQYTYAFSNWSVSSGASITSAQTIIATFTRTLNSYAVSATLAQCAVKDGSDPIPATMNFGDDLSTIIQATAGYTLPSTITVTGVESYTWDHTTGALTLTDVTGAVSISITAEAEAVSSSINIEKLILDNGKSYDLKAALDAKNISYSISNDDYRDSLDTKKCDHNTPYLGLKLKTNGGYIEVKLPASNDLYVKFGHIDAAVNVSIDEGDPTTHSSGDYSLPASGSNRIVRFTTTTEKAVVFKQIMIGEAIQSVTLPGKITTSTGGNGSITAPANGAKVNVGSTVNVTVSPSSGYELETLTYKVTSCSGDPTDIKASKSFTMPDGDITINATFVASCTDPGLTFASSSKSVTLCDEAPTNALTNTHGVTVSYASSNTSVAEVASDGTITLVGAGETTITASSDAETVSEVDYCADEATYTITVTASTAAGLAYGTSTIKKDVGDDAFTNTLTNSNGLTVTYTSSNEDVATVDATGEVTIKVAGTTTITANSAQQKVSSTCYAAGSATYTLTVYPVYTVTYNAMGGTCSPTSTNTTTALGKVTLPSATHASYTTYSWVTSDGTEAGDAGDTYTPEGNINLYAKWSGSCAGGGGSPTTIVLTDFGKQFSTSGPRYGRAYVGNISGDVHIIESNDAENQKIGDKDSTAIRVDYGSYIKVLGPNATVADYTTDSTFSSVSRVEFRFKMFNANSGGTTTTIDVYVGNSKVASAIEVTGEKTDPFKAISPITISPAKNGAVRIVNTGSGSTNKNIYLDSIAITYSGGSSCYTVTYHGNGATSGYVNDPEQYPSGTTVYTAYNSSITGFKKTGYEFNGWNTTAAGDGEKVSYFTITENTTLFAQWKYVIDSNNEDFAGYDAAPTQYQDVLVTNGATLTLTKSTNVHDITVETGSTLNVAEGSSGVTLATNSISLVGGWGTVGNSRKYDMPRVYIDPASKITREEKDINFDIAVDNRNFYPIAVPFPVEVADVDYADAYLAGYSRYGVGGQYLIKTYDGQLRADYGGIAECWRNMTDGSGYEEPAETLLPGRGYILRAVPARAGGYSDEYAVIRFPMKNVDDKWTAAGEKGSIVVDEETKTKNVVAVEAYLKDGDTDGTKTPNANKGWNILGVPFMSRYQATDDIIQSPTEIIQGHFDYSTNKWDDDEIRYVTIPTYDFSEYNQYSIEDEGTILLPGWCFFVQVKTSGNLKFLSASEAEENEAMPIYAPKREQERKPTVKTGIILTGANAKDKTTIIVSDKYNAAEYEINADLEKMFGENGYTLATYTLSGETRLAYNAMNNADIMDVIPVGYRAPEEGEYTFSINPRYAESEAFEQVNLIDYQEGVVTNLLQSSYSFTTARTQNDARFAINVVKRQDTATDVENVQGGDAEPNKVRKVIINDKMYILLDGRMYDATGKSVK